MKTIFNNSTEAFEYFYDFILKNGRNQLNTKSLNNIGFYINNPIDRNITTKYRNWSNKYAELEWKWYLSENRNGEEIAKYAKIWYNCMDENGNVNSNYGWQWNRNNQLENIIYELKENKESRRANITIHDAKEYSTYKLDTPCTLSIQFSIENNKLNMSVLMRSNDLVYGFCNDQYCFSKLQELVLQKLIQKYSNLEIGNYYHFSQNFHIYERHFNLKNKNINNENK